ncbi:MAG TPA: CaiB/BaiF CoA-transferase family protein [bacterium]|nr:CaiB/BaiF CoA-transferase family protein [bacterium]
MPDVPDDPATAPLLAGLTVVELASVLAGPLVGQFLAELGADVLKIEHPGTGDVTRSWKGPTEDPFMDTSAYFAAANWGKSSRLLDLTSPAGQAELLDLTARADIVLASYKPGDAPRLGADYVTLSRHNPRLIYAHLTGYGTHTDRAGYDAVLQAETGFMYLNAAVDEAGRIGPPQKMPVALVDVLASHQLKEGILTALYRRALTGQGALIEVSLVQSALASLANQATSWLVAGANPQPLGSEHPSIVPYGTILTAADGQQLVLAVGSDRQFALLMDVLNHPDIAHDERFQTNPARVRHRKELNAILRSLVSRLNGTDLLTRLHQRHVPAGAVLDVAQALASPHAEPLLLRDPASSQARPGGVRTAVFQLDGQLPAQPLSPPPSSPGGAQPITGNQQPDANN